MDINNLYGDKKGSEELLKLLEFNKVYGLFSNSLAELSEQLLNPIFLKKELIKIVFTTNRFVDSIGNSYRYFYYLDCADCFDDDYPDISDECWYQYNVNPTAVRENILKDYRIYGFFSNSLSEIKILKEGNFVSFRLENCIEDKDGKIFVINNEEKFKFFFPIRKEKIIYKFEKTRVCTAIDADSVVDDKFQGFFANSLNLLRNYVETNNRNYFGKVKTSKVKFNDNPYYSEDISAEGFRYFYPLDDNEL